MALVRHIVRRRGVKSAGAVWRWSWRRRRGGAGDRRVAPVTKGDGRSGGSGNGAAAGKRERVTAAPHAR